jgi:hypothetical protein
LAPVAIKATRDGGLVKALPAFVILAVWLVLVITLRRRDLLELRREIDELKT